MSANQSRSAWHGPNAATTIFAVAPAESPDPRLDPAVQRALQALGCTDADQLRIGGLKARDLLQQYGSPLYVFDLDLVRSRALAVRAGLGPRIGLLWSIKANPNLAVTKTLRAAGCGIEIASLGELEVALRAGHDPAAIRFAGPGKTDAELDTAVRQGIGCVHAESADEVDALANAARRHHRRQSIAVRVNIPGELHGARLRMSGASSRFGVDAEQVPALLRRIHDDPSLELRGLHAYSGTQGFDASAFVQQAHRLAELADRWERELHVPLRELDLGGGFGMAHYLGDPEFDFAAAMQGLGQLLARHDRPDRRWFVELGRYLVAPAGVYLATVTRTKVSGGTQHLVLDGGLHHCGIAAGQGTVLRRPPLVVATGALAKAATESYQIGGPLCTPQDQFAGTLQLPPLRHGDPIAVLAAGAYGLSYSSTGFLSHATPAEVAVEGGSARIVRDRGNPSDALRGQRD